MCRSRSSGGDGSGILTMDATTGLPLASFEAIKKIFWSTPNEFLMLTRERTVDGGDGSFGSASEGCDLIDLQVYVKDVVEGLLWISQSANAAEFYGPAYSATLTAAYSAAFYGPAYNAAFHSGFPQWTKEISVNASKLTDTSTVEH